MDTEKNNVRVYIDGENFTISLYEAQLDKGEVSPQLRVHWWALAKTYLRPQKNEELDKVLFCTAVTKKASNVNKHYAQLKYNTSLGKEGVNVMLGKLKERERQCPECGEVWKVHEEKHTDVNIALQMLADAEDHKFSRALLVTGDTDLVNAVKMVRERHPDKEVDILLPPRPDDPHRKAHEFTSVASRVQQMTIKRVRPHLYSNHKK